MVQGAGGGGMENFLDRDKVATCSAGPLVIAIHHSIAGCVN